MSLVVVGLNHRTAPLEMLEKVTMPSHCMPKALTDLSRRTYITESVILSTCNRTEIYVQAEKFHGAYQDVRDFLAEFSFAAPEDFSDCLYTYYDADAAAHLFNVACGLDSIVLGETEIQGQVKTSWQLAQAEATTGPVLNSLFRHALQVGKRARTETGISRHITSVSQAAIALAKQHFDSLADRRIMLLGAGDMGTGMGLTLADVEAADLVVASRTESRAIELAERIGARHATLDQLDAELKTADLVFTSTAAPDYIVGYDALQAVMAERADAPLVLVDIAMPRDVDPAVANLDGVTVLDMDAVGAFSEQGRRDRRNEVDRVRSIIDGELTNYLDDAGTREVAPLISDFRGWADAVRVGEIDRFASRLADLTPEQRESVEALTVGLLGKLLYSPTVRLKDAANTPQGDRLAAALRELFDLG